MQNHCHNNQRAKGIVIDWGLPVLYFLLMYFFFPFRDAFWMDFDEGINLVKAQMLLRGYSLYSEIWSDQPPLLTYVLALVFRIFGMEASVGRILVLVLSCGLIWAYLHFLRIVWGDIHAIAGFVLLLLLPRFSDLSVSVMVGLPAIIFAFFSMLALVYWHRWRKYHSLVISAFALAISVLIKIFTSFLVPIFLIGIIAGEFSRYREGHDVKKLIRPATIWGATFALLIFLLLIIMVGLGNLNQLLGNHLDASSLEKYRSDPNYWLNTQLVDASPILVLAMLGGLLSVLSERWLALYPTAWMIFSYLILAQYVPVWSHQQLLVTIPAALLASASVGEALKGFPQIFRTHNHFSIRPILYPLVFVVFVYVLIARGPITASAFSTRPILETARYKETSSEAKIMRRVLRYAPYTHWMITDIPMFAFYANIPVPPRLIVFSSKRLETGNLTEEQVINAIEELHPEQVLLGRNVLPKIRSYLNVQYKLVRSEDLIELYVSKDIISADQSP